MKTAKLRRWSKGKEGEGGKKISLSFQALPVLYSYMQQSNVPQLEGNSICAAVRNAKYIPEYMATGRKYTQCRGTCPKELESSFPFPFAKCVISFQLFTTCSRNVDRRIEESFEKKNVHVKFPRRLTKGQSNYSLVTHCFKEKPWREALIETRWRY